MNKTVLTLLEKTASALIKKYRPKIICVTGSVGKTSTKEAIACALSTSYRIRKTSRNYNNDYGVPISVIGGFESEEGFLALFTIYIYGLIQWIFRLNFPEILVLEVGAGKIGEIERITSWLKPDVVVVTNLPDVPSHLGIFGSKEMIIKEKKFLINNMNKEGILIIDKNEPNSKPFYSDFNGKIFFYDGKKNIKDSHYQISYKKENSFLKPVGFSIQVPTEKEEKITLSFHGFLGTQNVRAITVALIVTKVIGCDLDEAIEGIRNKYKPECGRLRIFEGIKNDVTIIDDSFNSSPIAVENSLITMLSIQITDQQRRIAVLGDMFKLGNQEREIHQETGTKEIPQADILITVGNISEIWQKYNANRLKLNKHFKNSTNAAHYIQGIQKPGDIIHFKGGHLTRLEKAVALLTNCPKKFLVRQEKYYTNSKLELNQESADYE